MINTSEIGPPLRREDFVKSTFSNPDTGCLHIDRRDGFVLLWEDGDPFSAEYITKVPNKSLVAFVNGAKAGEFDDIVA